MSAAVFARSRSRMYTAFLLADGRGILNVAAMVDGGQRCVSIELDEEDRRVIASDERAADARVEHLVRHGRRLDRTLPTPGVSEPVRSLAA